MSKLVFYRKYRPVTFDDLIGQEIIVKILKEASRQEKFAHAYLFAGPRGSGKTTTARLIAKALNCLKRAEDSRFCKKGEPCNICKACQEINEGKCFDIIEIDAASNRGIDEIRNLKENARVSPARYKHKVFIIDEAHQLTKDAMSALLKTLEEPPPGVFLMLATTEIDKIPPTISSRTQQFFFHRASVKEISEKLKKISEAEKVKISPDAIELIASSAEGSFRDAESFLDQLVSFRGSNLTLEDIELSTGKIGFKKISELAGFLLKKELPNALELISEIYDSGFDMVSATKDLIVYLRRIIVLKNSPRMEKLFKNELADNHLKKLVDHSNLVKEKHIELLKNLINAYSNMRYNQFPIIPLEVAIIESLK